MDAAVDVKTVQERTERLRELTEFTEKCQKQLRDIYKLLNWSPELTNQKQEEMATCPFDSGHRVPLQSLERHKHSCSLRKMGYTPEEQAEMCDSSVCYQNKPAVRSFIMDDVMQQQVIQKARAAAPLMKMEGVFWQGQFSSGHIHVPQNHKRAICDLTVADRLALYDHVTQSLNSQDPCQLGSEDLYVDLVKKLQKDEEQTEPKSQLELMAEMRDYKRRRQSYRAKNVHITKKSYTEVIREVISVHSAELARQWSQEVEEGGASSDTCPRHERHQGERHQGERRHGERRRERSSSSESAHSRQRGSRERSDDEPREKKRRKSVEHKKKKAAKKKKKKRKEEREHSR
ncbi:U11/U12 small nuclear ribonucleoprotein 48 kDa protein [Neosynchiropus ocellatus]